MEHHLVHSKTFRYEVFSKSKHPNKILYVLHGYGQLSKFFIRKFNGLGPDWLVVAPEGMHRFYLDSSHDRVGASWMTREDRETDIRDNLSYLNAVNEEIEKTYRIDTRVLLGFSQGGATAARWNVFSDVHFDTMILWACVYPPDLLPETAPSPSGRNIFVLGSNDRYFSRTKSEETIQFYRAMNFEIERFEGDHDIDNKTLTTLLTKST